MSFPYYFYLLLPLAAKGLQPRCMLIAYSLLFIRLPMFVHCLSHLMPLLLLLLLTPIVIAVRVIIIYLISMNDVLIVWLFLIMTFLRLAT